MCLEEVCDTVYKLAVYIYLVLFHDYNDEVGHHMQQTPHSANKSTSKTLQLSNDTQSDRLYVLSPVSLVPR